MLKNLARGAYRLLRSSVLQPVSESLPAELSQDCRFCSSRVEMLAYLPHSAVVAELGTQTGRFAREILQRTNPRELHLIDRDYSQFDSSGLCDSRVVRHVGDTSETVATFAPNYFDWVYIDADHSYKGVSRDIAACMDRVKPGGFLVFNDFAHIDPYLGRYGVHRAVTRFVNEARWPLRFFAYETAALYDVAIQRPI